MSSNPPILSLDWGIKGLESAIKRNDNIVIIDQIRFSSAVVTAIALGFTIEPTSDKSRRTESFSLSPSSYFNKKPQRVVIASPNGAFLSINSRNAKNTVFGSILNAKVVAEWIDSNRDNTTLVAAGEVDIEERKQFLGEKEIRMAKGNNIFALEDFVAVGAISYYSQLTKSEVCMEAQNYFDKVKGDILRELIDTTSHRYNEARGNGGDTALCSKLNLYNVVPKLHFVDDSAEITS
jgi:phosphosulfolactate phosphohydrolase-like enzyme